MSIHASKTHGGNTKKMSLKINKQAYAEFKDKALIEQSSKLVNDGLIGFLTDRAGRVLYCSETASTFSVTRGMQTICDLAVKEQNEMLRTALSENSNSCTQLRFRKKSFMTLEFIEGGLYLGYIFVDSYKIANTIPNELMRVSFSSEYAKKLTPLYGLDNCAELVKMLEKRQMRIEEYNRLLSEAKQKSKESQIDLNMYLRLLTDYVTQYGDLSGVSLVYCGGDPTAAIINNSVFAKIFCAAVSYMVAQAENDIIELSVKCETPGRALVCFSALRATKLEHDTYYNYLTEIAMSLGWEIKISCDSELNGISLSIDIPAENISPETFRSTKEFLPLEKLLDMSTDAKAALLML